MPRYADRKVVLEILLEKENCFKAGGHWWVPALSSWDEVYWRCAMCTEITYDPEDGPLKQAYLQQTGRSPDTLGEEIQWT